MKKYSKRLTCVLLACALLMGLLLTGCGVAIKAREAHIPIRAVTNLIRHPNFGGELMVVGLGCEKLTYDMVLPPEDITPENTLTLQNYRGHDAMMQALMEMAERKLKRLNERRREELPLSELLIGMQCGGDVTVLFEYVSADDLRWSLLAGAVCDRIEAGKHGWLVLPLDGSVPSLYGEEGLLCGEGVSEEERAALCTTHTVVTSTCYAEPLPLFNRVVIFGGGHITQALTPMLGAVDFRCVVLDNRPAFADISLFKGAEDAIVCNYDNIAESVTLTAEDYVVVMTNGHSGDLIIEEQVLRSPHAYLGVVGSRSKIAFVNKTLMDRGIPEEALKAVHTPIGTPIRAVTPAEIAVSILGELILCRAEIREGEMPAHHGCPMHG